MLFCIQMVGAGKLHDGRLLRLSKIAEIFSFVLLWYLPSNALESLSE